MGGNLFGRFEVGDKVADVVGGDLQLGAVGGLGDDGELAVEQLPAGVADHPRPEVLQLAPGRGVAGLRDALERCGQRTG